MKKIYLKKVLLIEDDRSLAYILKEKLKLMNFDVDVCLLGDLGLRKALTNQYSFVMTDIALPKISGLSILNQVRQQGLKTPFIVMTNYNINLNEIKAYQEGANIFHKKPINFELLESQISSLIKLFDLSKVIKVGDVELNYKKGTVTKNGEEIKLTKNEFDLLFALFTYPGDILSRADIVTLTQRRTLDVEESSVDTLVSRLRRKIGKVNKHEVVETVFGQGYRLNLNLLGDQKYTKLNA